MPIMSIARARRGVLGHERRELVKERDVVGEQVPDVRPLHLHDDRPSVAQLGGMHLSQAGRAERLPLEHREQLAQATAELLLDDVLDVARRGIGSTSSWSFSSSSMYGGGKQVGPRGEHLAELDVRRSELDEALAKRLGPVPAIRCGRRPARARGRAP